MASIQKTFKVSWCFLNILVSVGIEVVDFAPSVRQLSSAPPVGY